MGRTRNKKTPEGPFVELRFATHVMFPEEKKSPNKKKLSYTYQIHKSSFLPWKASRILTAKTSLASTAYPARHQPDGGAMVSQPTAKRFIGAPKWSAEMPCWQETCRSTKTAFGAKGSISKYRNKWAQSYLDGKIKKCRIVFFCCAPKMCQWWLCNQQWTWFHGLEPKPGHRGEF